MRVCVCACVCMCVRVRATSLTTGSLLLPHAITTTPYTCLCNYIPLTEPTNPSRGHGFPDPETHLCATTHVRRRGLCFCNTQAAVHMQSGTQPRQLQARPRIPCFCNTHVCAQSLPMAWVLLHAANMRARVHVCVCLYVCLRAKKRHAAKSQQHPLPQCTRLHASATHICAK